jgi:hypothetical protein
LRKKNVTRIFSDAIACGDAPLIRWLKTRGLRGAILVKRIRFETIGGNSCRSTVGRPLALSPRMILSGLSRSIFGFTWAGVELSAGVR